MRNRLKFVCYIEIQHYCTLLSGYLISETFENNINLLKDGTDNKKFLFLETITWLHWYGVTCVVYIDLLH